MLFSRNVRRLSAVFCPIIASRWAPLQMGPVVAAKEWGSFSLIRTNENRPICVRGNDLSRRHTGGALGIVGAWVQGAE